MGPARQACKGGTVSIGGRLLSELFRRNGIHHADSCTSRDSSLGPIPGTTSGIDVYESPAGETIYTCNECERLAIWKDRVLQPDPIWELEHLRVRGPGEQERADAAVELERLQRRNAEDSKRSRPVEPRKPRMPGRPLASGLRIPNAEALLREFRLLKETSGRQPTQHELAKKMGQPPTTLRDALKRFELNWPPE
jgi:hypothetical protein